LSEQKTTLLGLFKRPDIIITFALFLLMIPLERYEIFQTIENELISVRHHFIRNNIDQEGAYEFLKDKIAIIVQDEDFFEEYGSFPLKREDLGIMVENLSVLGAKVIMVDMIMDFASSYGEDPIIAGHLEASGNTVLVSQLVFRGNNFVEVNYPTPTIHKATETAYSNHTEIGGQLNRIRLFPDIINKHNEWPISVKTTAAYLGVEPKLENGFLVLGEQKIQLDHFNDFWIDYLTFMSPSDKPEDQFLSKDPFVGISGLDIIELDIDDEYEIAEYSSIVKDKIVFIGDTSEVGHDLFDTMVGQAFGVEILAQEVATLLRGVPLRSAPLKLEIVMLLLFLAFFILAHQLKHPLSRGFITIVLTGIYFFICVLFYMYNHTIISMTYTLIAALGGFITINGYLFVLERKQKSFITNAFGQYLSPKVIDILVKNPDKLSLGGERREMTAYFSDIGGFSSISEKLTPDQLVSLLNEYLTEMTDIISKYDGTVDKFEGDAIIAFWGAPLEQPDNALRCCLATIEMQNRMKEIRAQFAKEDKPVINVRMGINTGPMVVGNMGSQTRMDYTIMGDAVNLAARLEGANKYYNTYTMISHYTYNLVKDEVEVRELDTIRVIGKKEPITVYELIETKGNLDDLTSNLVRRYNSALELYKNRKFGEAKAEFESIVQDDPEDGPSKTYISRCEAYLKEPPEDDWDGVYNLTAK
jgi:adenylate cyclase